MLIQIPYSGKLSEGENFHEFRDFSAIRESFLHEIPGMPHPLCDQLTFRESFLREMLLSYRSAKVFSLEISRYTVIIVSPCIIISL